MKHIDQEKQEQRSMMIALTLVIVVLFGFNRLIAPRQQVITESLPLNAQVEPASAVGEKVSVSKETPDTLVRGNKETHLVDQQLPDQMISIKNDLVDGSFQAAGTTFNSLFLTQYKETTESDSPAVSLLNKGFQANLNWESESSVFPDMSLPPHVEGEELTPFTPIVLTWQSETVTVERTVSLDNAYMIRLTDKIINRGKAPIKASLVGQIVRNEDAIQTDRSAVHEGFLAFIDNREVEEKYVSIKEDQAFSKTNKGGWIGITDKYWQTVFIPDQKQTLQMIFSKREGDYVASFVSDPTLILSEGTTTYTTQLFAGAKVLELLNDYTKQGVPRFDLSIDFGWYYFLTKPFLYFLGFLYSLVGNMGIAILVFATLLRIALLPIATKSYESMAKMKKIQPKIKALQERFKDNKQQLQIEMMNLYKRDKVNPASGCLPLLIQIPVFFALYKVLSVSILMRQAPFFGWITDLSVRDPSSVFTAFGYLPWPIPSILNIGIWPVIMGLTMVISQKMSAAAPADENQRIVMNMMPVIFTFMMGNFAAGLVIYWTWNNILSIAQQKYIMKKVGV